MQWTNNGENTKEPMTTNILILFLRIAAEKL